MSPAVMAIIVATVGGAAVGIERQRSGHASGPTARFAGVRTFTLLGAISGLAGQLWTWGAMWPATVLLVAASALVVVAYARASRRDVDGTTEVAALVVLAAGTAAGLGQTRLASGIIAVTVVLLVEKTRLHGWVARLEDKGLAAAARFAVMAVVVLPLLPEGPYGPWGGIRPRELWLLVLFFSGLSFIGYLARALVGDRRGYAVAGLLGGLVSSTQVTLSFARLSRTHPELSAPLAQGVVAANTVLFARVLVAAAVLNAAVGTVLIPYIMGPFLVGLIAMVVGPHSQGAARRALSSPRNPLELRAALEMVVAFQAVLGVLYLSQQWFEDRGLLPTAMVLGLSDVDALTMSMTTSASAGHLTTDQAGLAIAAGIAANMGVKLVVAAVIGRGRFRATAVGALSAIGIALVASIVLLR